MTLTLQLPENKEAALKARAEAHGVSAEQYVQDMLDQNLETPVAAAPQRHISEIIREIWSDLPEEALAKLPVDGASQVDHYIYGWPKKDN